MRREAAELHRQLVPQQLVDRRPVPVEILLLEEELDARPPVVVGRDGRVEAERLRPGADERGAVGEAREPVAQERLDDLLVQRLGELEPREEAGTGDRGGRRRVDVDQLVWPRVVHAWSSCHSVSARDAAICWSVWSAL